MTEERWGPDEADPAAGGSGSGGKFHMLQPNRDLEANWTVDLAKNLEDYLLKICSGEIDADGEEMGHLSINFAEAAMLLQGSIQVYSRKVEYLYTLVVHAMEFLSRDKHDYSYKSSLQTDGKEDEDQRATAEDDGDFMRLDDVPVDAKNCLDDEYNDSDNLNHLVRPPANLVVLEGDCLESISEASELESYQLSTCNFYGDFLLLDPSDAEAVYDFTRNNSKVKEHSATQRSSVLKMKAQSSFRSPLIEKSGGKAQRSAGMKQDATFDQHFAKNIPSDSVDHDNDPYENPDHGYPDINDDSDDDDDDPWKPLNPHEAGNLRIKPFKRCSIFKRKTVSFRKCVPTSLEFPEAKVEGTIDPELAEVFAKQIHAQTSLHSQSLPLLEKLRQSLSCGKAEAYDVMRDLDDENNDAEDDSDVMDSTEPDDVNLTQNSINIDVEVPLHNEKQTNISQFNGGDAFGKNDVDTEKSLEDLCRSHLDSLLASIVEAEKQTEIAARVSTWKQKIEHTLNEEDSHRPFDIHLYGEKILNKLSDEAGNDMSMGFTDIVMGQPKHDIARTFSALLQLVNDGTVDLERESAAQSTCFTSVNPFHVRLISHERRDGLKFLHLKRRIKSPLSRKPLKAGNSMKSPLRSEKKGGSAGSRWLTPEGKKRRRSRLVGLPSVG